MTCFFRTVHLPNITGHHRKNDKLCRSVLWNTVIRLNSITDISRNTAISNNQLEIMIGKIAVLAPGEITGRYKLNMITHSRSTSHLPLVCDY